MSAVLSVADLRVELRGREGAVAPVDGVTLRVSRGEIVGLVGESGSGKSLTSLAVMGLLPQPGGRVARGSVRLSDDELVGASPATLRSICGRRVAMIFQDPMACLNPYLRIGEQLVEGPRLHLGLSRRAAIDRAVELLERVGLPDARARLRSYPHELSGGMRQRVMIAMALGCEPELLIADEPTTALDVTIQAQILGLLRELRDERQMSILLISHDLGVVGTTCERVYVMYAGQIVEAAPTATLFRAPSHPYTRALLACTPTVDERRVLRSGIPGRPPAPPPAGAEPVAACRFLERCSGAQTICGEQAPALEGDGERERRCWIAPEELGE